MDEAVEKSCLSPTTRVDGDEQEQLGDDGDDEEIKAIALDYDRRMQALLNMKKKAIDEIKRRKMEVKEARQAEGSSDKSSADTYDAAVKNASTLGVVGGVTLLSEPPADCDPPLIPCIPSYPDVDSSLYSPVPKSFQPVTVTGFSKFPSYMIRSVEAALLRYNQKNGGPVLKLVEITCVRGTVKRVDGSTTVHHIKFLAQFGNDPSGMVLFFAEGFHAIYNKTYAIGLCCPLNNEAGNRNCGFYRAYTTEQIKHPPGGFYAAVDPDIEAPPGQEILFYPAFQTYSPRYISPSYINHRRKEN